MPLRKILFFVATSLICSQSVLSQKARDVVENGTTIKKDNYLFLKYDTEEKKLKVDEHESIITANFTKLEDSTIYLSKKNGINVYIRPLNPLSYTWDGESKIIIDPIDDEALKALSDIVSKLPESANSLIQGQIATNIIDNTKFKLSNEQKALIESSTSSYKNKTNLIESIFKNVKIKLKSINDSLGVNKKDLFSKIFNSLKSISFNDSKSTGREIRTCYNEINKFESFYNEIETQINQTQKMIDGITEDSIPTYTLKFIFNSIIKEQKHNLTEQKKRVDQLRQAYTIVNKVYENATTDRGPHLSWSIPTTSELETPKGKINLYTITIKESGLKLNDSKELVNGESKEILKKTIRVRRFQRFIPEVSIGTAITSFKYLTYGTTTDSTGQQFVGTPVEAQMRNINIATMINFNYFIPESQIHPFCQLGAGINSGMPTLLAGFGIRSNISGLKRLAVSGGIATTWLRQLTNLKVGDKVSGTADIEKDFKFNSAPTFAPYFSIQFNL
jgi:hypothetical protein